MYGHGHKTKPKDMNVDVEKGWRKGDVARAEREIRELALCSGNSV